MYVGADDCVEREYPAGTAFVDLGHGDVHTAFNATDDVTVLVATFFEAPEAGPLLMPAETPADCAILGRPTRSLPPAATAGAGRTRPNGSDELPDRDGTGRSDRDVGLRDLSGGSVRLVDDRLQGLDPLEERSDGEVVRERLFVLVAGRPDLLPVRGVQPGVVPDDRPGRGGPAALGRADRGGRFVVHWASLSAGVTLRPPADPPSHGSTSAAYGARGFLRARFAVCARRRGERWGLAGGGPGCPQVARHVAPRIGPAIAGRRWIGLGLRRFRPWRRSRRAGRSPCTVGSDRGATRSRPWPVCLSASLDPSCSQGVPGLSFPVL